MSLSFWIRTFFFLHQIFGFLDFFLEFFSKLVVRFLYFLSLWFLNCCFWFSDLVYNDKDVSHSSLSHDHHGHNPDNLSVKDIPDLDVALEEKSSWVVPTVVHNLVMIIIMIMLMMMVMMMMTMMISSSSSLSWSWQWQCWSENDENDWQIYHIWIKKSLSLDLNEAEICETSTSVGYSRDSAKRIFKRIFSRFSEKNI